MRSESKEDGSWFLIVMKVGRRRESWSLKTVFLKKALQICVNLTSNWVIWDDFLTVLSLIRNLKEVFAVETEAAMYS